MIMFVSLLITGIVTEIITQNNKHMAIIQHMATLFILYCSVDNITLCLMSLHYKQMHFGKMSKKYIISYILHFY